MIIKKRVFTLLALALFVLCQHMHATPLTLLTLNDGLGDSVAVDETGTIVTAGFASGSALSSGPHGTIIFAGSVGQFTLNVTTGRGGAAETLPALMNLNSIDAASIGAGILTVMFSDRGYTDLSPTGLVLAASGTETASAVGSYVTFKAFADATGAIPSSTLIGSLGAFTSSSFSQTKTFINPIGTSGSLMEQVVLKFKHAGDINTGFTISNDTPRVDCNNVNVPEPTSMALLGGVLLFAGNTLRRKLQI